MDFVKSELGVSENYMFCADGRISVTAHRSWLSSFTTIGPVNFVYHDRLSADEISAQPSLEELGSKWSRIYVKVYKKQKKNAIPLPKGRPMVNRKIQSSELTFAQLLHYVADTNYRNLWKESYKKYLGPWNATEQREHTSINGSATDTEVMQEVLSRLYDCTMVQIQNGVVTSVRLGSSNPIQCSLLPANFVIEAPSTFFVFYEQTAKYSLRECVTYSPAMLSSCNAKPLFLVYQLLRLSRDLHDLGLVLGDVTLSDILLMDNLTIQVLPNLNDNIYLWPENDYSNTPSNQENRHFSKFFEPSTNKMFGTKENVEELCEMWVHGVISNFDYLTALNNLAGRRYGDPNCHHVMPWITDFSTRSGLNWRDLTKSKYRLNKGDRQLDLTYDSQTSEVGHHVSDVLSEITYYVYLSRQYSKYVLCKHVRPFWVPCEYPGSIQRLFDWSPDECIPQFFDDPSVFKSIHEDMPDLEIPAWATSPEDFVHKHREALESNHVSERLHHWIDLTFGYKLSGSAAVKSKNVCRQLVDNHTSLTKAGVVQLFTQPHPQKVVFSPYWSKFPVRYHNLGDARIGSKNDKPVEKTGESDEFHESNVDEEEEEEESPVPFAAATRSSPLALSRLLSRSRASLLASEDTAKVEKSQSIVLPKDFNPASMLVQVETMHAFMNKISHRVYKPKPVAQTWTKNFRQIVASGRIKEQQILGCLILEIFLPRKFRATWNASATSFQNRLNNCLSVVKTTPESLPRCVRNAVMLLLQIDALPKSYGIQVVTNPSSTDSMFRYATVTHSGLPPPSPHQFLQSVLCGNLFPSTSYFRHLFSVVEMIREYDALIPELNSVLQNYENNEALNKTRLTFLCKISECKVKAIARQLEKLLSRPDNVATNLQLIVPYVKQILEEPYSAVLAAWYLLDPIAKALGPKNTADTFLLPILKLYENGSVIDTWPLTGSSVSGSLAKLKTTRLYHRTFLLKLIVRLGLRRFLENFITPLVEAVGGYRDHVTNVQRTGNLKTCYLTTSCGETENVLSPLDEDSSFESDHNTLPSQQNTIEHPKIFISNNDETEVPETIFTMETEEPGSSGSSETRYKLEMQMELSLNLRDDLFLEDLIKSSSPDVMKSPVIPIPKKSLIDFSSIDCDVGSKTSSTDTPFGSSHAELEEVDVAVDAGQEEDEQRCRRAQRTECKISEMGAESIVWLSHRLGPVLTARHLSRNLLRMLTLCYAEAESFVFIESEDKEDFKWCKSLTVGDLNAAQVLECLIAIVGLYGEQIIVRQYFAHVTELLTLCKRKLTPNLESGLVSCLVLLVNVIPCLSDATLMDVLHEVIVKSILHPAVRILSTTKYSYPNGKMARSALARKCLEALFILSSRLGNSTTKTNLAVVIQRFFLAFDKVFDSREEESGELGLSRKDHNSRKYSEATDCYSPQLAEEDETTGFQGNRAFEELKSVFTEQFAHRAYVTFYRLFGETFMEEILRNHSLIRTFCQEYEQEIQLVSPSTNVNNFATIHSTTHSKESESREIIEKGAGSFGNMSVIGNKIEVLRTQVTPERNNSSRESSRQLRGNWLAYWEHEIGRSDKDLELNIKQIKLQTFGGHSNSVRCLYSLDNENSFMSGSRDKTVKLWSLRNQGDGSTVSSCQFTYSGHKKSILSLTFLASLRYAVTSDGSIHCWDPFMGSLISCPESPRPLPVNVITASPAPSAMILVATTDITLRIIDCRTFQYVNEMKVSMNPTGLIRCIAVAPSGNWVVLGQASGFLTTLDIRTGLIIASWKGHECEILQLEVLNETTIISSSLDQTIAVWSAVDGKIRNHMKYITEPVHCMSIYENQLVTGTTANRIGVHSSTDNCATFSSAKLKPDAFKGVLTSMSVLPLNRLLLLGADNGLITLMC